LYLALVDHHLENLVDHHHLMVVPSSLDVENLVDLHHLQQLMLLLKEPDSICDLTKLEHHPILLMILLIQHHLSELPSKLVEDHQVYLQLPSPKEQDSIDG
jgi:hypothetical protein